MTRSPRGRMACAEIMAERDRFGQLLVQSQDLGDTPRDLRPSSVWVSRVR